jgi:peptidoglycan hydrolase CwlO-like protein
MKVVLSGLVWCALALVLPARAAQVQPSTGDQASGQKQVEQAIAKQQVSVKQLQGDVEREESRTHQADAKLKQQDQAIADLQHQLEALKATPQGAGHP